MTLLIPLLLRLTMLFERGNRDEEPSPEVQKLAEESPVKFLEKE